jgi:hypothetical protein
MPRAVQAARVRVARVLAQAQAQARVVAQEVEPVAGGLAPAVQQEQAVAGILHP